MRINKLLIVSLFLLAIFTLGAVSAADDSADNLTVDEVVDSISEVQSGENELSIDESDISQLDEDDDKEDPDMYVGFYSKDSDGDVYSIEDDIIWADNHNNSYIGVTLPDDARGKVSLYIDDNYRGYKNIWGSTRYFYANSETYNLTLGNHNWEIKYSGDDNYQSKILSGTFNLNLLKHNIGDYMYLGEDVNFRFSENAKGNLKIFIDDDEYNRQINNDYKSISLDELDFGVHTYKIIYVDEKYGTVEESGKFNLTYEFRYYFSNYYEQNENEYTLIYGDSNIMTINLPDDASSDIHYTINGKDYMTKAGGSESFIELSGLNMGNNEIKLSYCDNKYPIRTITTNIKCIGKFIDNYDEGYAYGDSFICSLTLPQNAKGNLHVYNMEYNDDIDDYDKVTIEKIPLVNGQARYVIPNLNVSSYNFYIEYDGSDYDVETYGAYFGVSPKVICPAFVQSNSTGNNLIVEGPNDYVFNIKITLDEDNIIYEGKLKGKLTVPLPVLELDDDSHYVFVIWENDDDSYENEYYIGVTDNLPKDTAIISFKNETSIVDNVFDEFILPDFANGHIIFIVDGKVLYNSTCDGFNKWDCNLATVGNHNVELRYEGDSYYNPVTAKGTVYVSYLSSLESLTNYGDLYVTVGENATGYISMIVDGKAYSTQYLKDGNARISLYNLSIGRHNYEFRYSGDKKYPSEIRTGSFDLSYDLYVSSVRDISENENDIVFEYGSTEFVIDIPFDGTGCATVTVDGQNPQIIDDFVLIPVEAQGLSGFFKAPDLSVGNHTIKVSYSDSKYPLKSIERNFTVVDSYRIHGTDYMYFHDDENISLILPKNANGNLVVNIDGVKNSIKVINGRAIFSLANLTPGKHEISASYDGKDYTVDEEIFGYEDTGVVYVYPKFINKNRFTVGEDNVISVEIQKEATGDFIARIYQEVDFGDMELINETIVKLTEGKGNVPISNLKLNKYGSNYIDFEYIGDDLSIPSEGLYFSINPINLTISSYEIFSNEKINVKFELPKDATGDVALYVYNKKINKYPLVNGVATIPLENLPVGNEVRVVLEYDGNYGHYRDISYIDVKNALPEIIISDRLTSAKESVFNIELPNDATGNITLSVNGKNYEQTLSNGKATINMPKLTPGDYEIGVAYSGNAKYEVVSNKTAITLFEAKINASDLSMIYTDGSKYSVKVYDTLGKLASGVNVVFKVNGKKVGTTKTNDEGVAILKLAKIPGKYKITTEALGVSVTKKLTVKHILTLNNIKVKKSAKKIVVKATLKKIKGKYLKGKKITFKFNGKKYIAKTNKKGVAKITISKSVIKKLKVGKKITYQATYLKDTVKKTIKVKK